MNPKSLLAAAAFYICGMSFGAVLGWFGPLAWYSDQHISEANQALQALWKEQGRVLEPTDPRVKEILSESSERNGERVESLVVPLAILFSLTLFAVSMLVRRMRLGDPILFSSPFCLLALFFSPQPLVGLLPALSGIAGVAVRRRRE